MWIFFFLVSYVSGTLWCSRIWNMRPESPRTVFNFKLMLFNWMYKSNCLLKYPQNKEQHWYKSVQFICQSDAHKFRYYSNSRVFFQNYPGSNSINIKDYRIPKTCHSYSFEWGKMQRLISDMTCLKETLAVFQYAFLSVLVFLWTCETSSVVAQVLFQFKVHI